MSAPNRDWWAQSQPNPAVVPPAQQQAPGSNNMLPYKWPVQSANTGLGPRQPPIPTDWPWGRNGAIGGPLTITIASLPPAYIGVPYSVTLTATGGTQPYTWSTTTTFPGLTLSSTGVLSGTPTSTGSVTPSFTVTDSASPPVNVTQTLPPLTISPAPGPLTITSTGYPSFSAFANNPFSYQFAATGGVPPYTWSWVTGGPIGGWFTMSPTGLASGIPPSMNGSSGTRATTTQPRVTDSVNTVVNKTMTIVVYGPGIDTNVLPAAQVGVPYSYQFQALGSPLPPVVWSIPDATLPSWASFDSSGYLSGTPTTAGYAYITFQVVDSRGSICVQGRGLQVNPAVVPEPLSMADVPNPLPDGYYPDQPYSFDLSPYSSGGTPPYAWGTWGTGWDTTDNGIIGGTPTWAGTMSITIQLTDSDGGSVQEDRTITIIDTSQPQYHRMYDGKKE